MGKAAGTIVDAAPRAAGSLVKSAGRTLQILELFDELQREARVSEIAEHLEYPQSSTSVLLKSLVQLGYLDYDPVSRTYLPSLRVSLLGSWLAQGPVRDGGLIRLMEELGRETGETIILATRNGIYAQYIHVVQATNVMRLHVPIGSRRLLVWSAAGFSLLSRTSDDDIRGLVRRTNAEAMPGQRCIEARQTLACVAHVRERGYYFSRGLVTPGAGLIGVPLLTDGDASGRPMSLGVSGWIEQLERDEAKIVQLMRDAIGRYLGPVPSDARQAKTLRADRKRRKK